MNLFKKGGRVRRLLPLALVVLPWFLKDHLATLLEEQSREAQQVLLEQGNQEQREQQGREIRGLNLKLAEIALRQKAGELSPRAIRQEEAETMADIIQAEGRAMTHSGKSLQKLIAKVDMKAEQRTGLEESARVVQEVGAALAAFDPKAAPEGHEALMAQWETTEARLSKAFEDLAEAAEQDREASAGAATTARFLAWIFTAVAALMVGGWKQVLGGAGSEEAEAEPAGSTAG
ncbi:MAG: hypothetical protein U0P46_06805 [Holophagaceae bacterium]